MSNVTLLTYLENEWYEPLCSCHLCSIRLADCVEQSFLFCYNSPTVNKAYFKEKDDQAEPVAEGETNTQEHNENRRVSRVTDPADSRLRC
jgi:hypothetical protein